MSTNFEQCMDLLKLCSLEEKMSLLKHLKEEIKTCSQSCSTENSPEPKHLSFDKLVSYYPSFIDDTHLLDDIWTELESLDLYRPNSKKIQSFWLNPGESNQPNSIHKFPNVMKLLNLVNKHESVPNSGLDCCNVICYSSDNKTLRPHSDNESNICQAHPICTFSIGAPRRIEFVPHGSNYTSVVRSLSLDTNASLYTMHPGCQSLLQHWVLPGCSNKSSSQVRYSISFQKSKPVYGDCSPTQPDNSMDVTSNAIKATLLVGDSFPARLDKERLGKKKKVVINMAKGGSRIPNVVHTVKEFRNNAENSKYTIDQVFISVGTNDIRRCYSGGVYHLRGELFGLVRTIKNLFPNTKIYMQSLLPLPVTPDNNRYVIRNVLDFNKLIYQVCSHEKVFMLDIFRRFLFEGYRNLRLFSNSIADVHPNARRLGVLARAYIDRIHGRYFDPFSLN